MKKNKGNKRTEQIIIPRSLRISLEQDLQDTISTLILSCNTETV